MVRILDLLVVNFQTQANVLFVLQLVCTNHVLILTRMFTWDLVRTGKMGMGIFMRVVSFEEGITWRFRVLIRCIDCVKTLWNKKSMVSCN